MFRNRNDAGIKLSALLSEMRLNDPVVYSIPRGGVVVGYEVAAHLNAQLAVIVVKKIGHPNEPEYAIGAMAEGEPETVVKGTVSGEFARFDDMAERTRKDVRSRVGKFRKGKAVADCRGRTAIVVDDGVATGLTARAALEAVRKMEPSELILATPVIDSGVEKELEKYCDRIVCVERVSYLEAVGSYYLEFQQVEDETVMLYLDAYEKRSRQSAGG